MSLPRREETKPVEILAAWNLGVPEISGLGSRRNPGLRCSELLAVSDQMAGIVTGTPAAAGALTLISHPVQGLPDDLTAPNDSSQWEGIAGDATGRMFVLREESSELLVIHPDFRFQGRVRLRHDWELDRREGLESLLLLQGGHILSVRQRRPVTFLEFGPWNAEPMGVSRTTCLHPDDAFQCDPGLRELACVATWTLDEDEIGSINDLALDEGALLGISSKSRCVASIGKLHVRRRRTHVVETWSLPKGLVKGHDAKGEGLLADARLGTFIGIDSHASRENLFLVRKAHMSPFYGL
jgi:hypothetical protein